MEHEQTNYDKSASNTKFLIILYVLFILFLGVSIMGIFYLTKTTRDRTTIFGINKLGVPYEVEQTRKYEQKMLSEYGVVDAQKGLYRIPIDKAMEKVIQQYR